MANRENIWVHGNKMKKKSGRGVGKEKIRQKRRTSPPEISLLVGAKLFFQGGGGGII